MIHKTMLVLAVFLSAAQAQAQEPADPLSPEGYWTSVDDDGTTPTSVVQIWIHNGKAHGKIVKLILQPGEEPDPLCEKCQGILKNKRVLGLKIIKNLVKDDDQWSGGRILDPDNGEDYKCYIEVQDGGKKLKVRGYIGFSLLGRTQYWHRTTKPTDEVEYLRP